MKGKNVGKPLNLIGPQIRKLRDEKKLSQTVLAVRLQCVGWDISRSSLAKIEARVKQVHDFQLPYLVEALEAELKDLYPSQAEPARKHVEKLMNCRY